MLVGLNLVAVRALNARRRGRTTDSDSDGERWVPFADCYEWYDVTDDDSDDVALRETREIADAIRQQRPVRLPPRLSSRCRWGEPLPSEATARGVAGLISLEVFRLFGGRRRHLDLLDVEPFVTYLARCAPHLREVGLFCVETSAVLPLRRTLSTEFTSLDLRHIWGLDDLTLATLLRSRTGRQLHSLKIVYNSFPSLFEQEWVYAALRHGGASDRDDVGGAADDAGSGDNGAHGPRQRPGELGIRRLHIDLSPYGPDCLDLTDLWMLGPRAVPEGG
jgi:hypothetical protein